MTSWPDLFVVENFLAPLECEKLLAEMQSVPGEAATVYGLGRPGAIEQGIRKTLRVRPSLETVDLVVRKLIVTRPAIEKHFGVMLNECEEPQFLRYREGDFFVAHQDGNTGLVRLDTERRLISTVIFLGQESESPGPDVYCGGSLVFSDLRSRFQVAAKPGKLVAFRSETTHEVTPVMHGERYSIASWYR